MKRMRKEIGALFFLGALLSAAASAETARTKNQDTWKVAVLYFENHASDEYGNFVRSIPDMLMTSLGKAERLKLIERVQIDKAIENFDLELSGAIDAQTAVEVGTWLGAEEVMTMVDRLGNGLVERFANRENEEKGGMGTLEVRFKTVKKEMGERPVYFHLCKLYVDGQYMGMSPVVEKVGEEVSLFARNLRTGNHQVRIVHGYVKAGEWDGEMPVQPRPFQVEIESGGAVTVRYAFEVGWFEDRYVYRQTW